MNLVYQHMRLPGNIIVRLLRFGRFLANDGFELRHRIGKGRRKYTFNENYFDTIDSEEKAYWLGFLAADGYNAGRGVKISVAKKDQDHIEKLGKCINHSHGTIPDRDAAVLVLGSKHIANAVSLYGVTPKKSLTLKFPENIPSNLVRHFIRGYFDGDGTAFKERDRIRIGFLGTESFLMNLQDTLIDKLSIAPMKISRVLHKNVYKMQYGNRKDIDKITHYLYDDSTIFLERKRNKLIPT